MSPIFGPDHSVKFVKMPREFYLRPTLRVARELLGKYLVRKSGGAYLVGRIVEVEAYLGDRDPASHAYRGQTIRNEIMFKPGGHLYVYFTYGMHYCCNAVTEVEGKGRAVLLRAVEPLSGMETMARNRKSFAGNSNVRELRASIRLTNGPAKLCEAFGIRREDNGADLLGDEIFISDGPPPPRRLIVSSTRIGITAGVEKRWRFYIRDNPFVSRKAQKARRAVPVSSRRRNSAV